MPRSRKRQGHQFYKKSTAVPASQRVKGRTSLAILFGIFGLLISLFASNSVVVIIVCAVLGAIVGYWVGKSMEKHAG